MKWQQWDGKRKRKKQGKLDRGVEADKEGR